ncbi:MAG: sodium:solute symporter family protein [Fimbriimonadia bacterium]
MARFVTADYVVVALFLALVFVAGFAARRKGVSEFMVAGRAVTLPALVATLVATWYGGILGVGEFTYNSGITNWFVNGFPYYVFAVLFAYLLAPRIRESDVYSLSDRLFQAYGRPASVIGGILTFLLTTPAPYLLMIGVLLQRVFGMGLVEGCIVGGILSTVYLYRGGLLADIRVNLVQFAAMYIGIAVILPFAVARYGGLEFLRENLPPLHWTWDGGHGATYVIAWFFIALWTLVDPSFHQRCAAARSPSVARKGILWSVALWFVFDSITTTVGLYARAVFHDPLLADPKMAFPELADAVLAPGFRGAFYVGLLATIMSTLVSYAFLGGVAFGRDILWRLRREVSEEKLPGYTRWGVALATVIGLVGALAIQSVVELWWTVGSCIIPGLLLPVVLAFFPSARPGPVVAVAMMIGGSVTSTAWFLIGKAHAVDGWPVYPLGVEPMYPGLLLTLLVYALTTLWGGIGYREREPASA